MNAPVSGWLLPALAAILTALLTSTRARAGLAEATDFDGPWTTGAVSYNGDSNDHTHWTEQSSETLDGVDAVVGKLGAIEQDETTWMQTTVNGPTTLYYSYRVVWPVRETGHDIFPSGSFTGPAVGLVLGASGGDTGWRHAGLLIPAGVKTLRWSLNYRKGRLGVVAYVDQLFTSDDARPRIPNVSAPAATVATPFSWTVPVVSSTPVTLSAAGLPPGLTVDAAAHILSGTPTSHGFFEVTLTALNGNGQFFAKHTINVAPARTSLPEALDAPTLGFTQAPDSGWIGVTGLGHDGVDCARAEDDTLSDTDTLSTTVVGPGTLSFWYRCDPLNTFEPSMIELQVGSSPASAERFFGGSRFWTPMTVAIPAGEQTISWRAIFGLAFEAKSYGPHYVYLDEVAFVPSPVVNVFDAWAVSYGLTGVNAGLSADPEGDGFTNWDEFCFASSPVVATASFLEATFAGTTLTLTWLQRGAIPYRLMETTDMLSPWTENPTIPIASVDQSGVLAGYTKMAAMLPLTAAAAGSPGATMFFRVEAGFQP